MQGRNGPDQLTVLTFVVYVIVSVINSFFKRHFAVYITLCVIMALLLAYVAFRMLSKNVGKRQLENEKFMVFWRRIRPKFILFKDRIKDIKTKRYRTCPGCKNVLRLPYSRGKHTVRCPKCGKEFKVRIL